MERVLDIYKRIYNPKNPVICFDESNKQHLKDVIEPLSPTPVSIHENGEKKDGSSKKEDHEYERNGISNLFMIFEPLTGQRIVEVTNRRTKKDFARCMQKICNEWYPQAEKITLVMDNLNTHTLACLYEILPPQEAKRIADRMEIVHTPKHGSWLNMAEIELSTLSKQCLNRRIANQEIMIEEVKAWQDERNTLRIGCNWQFKIEDARVKLKKLYPTLSE